MTYESEVLADSPVGYWHIDETLTTDPTADSSGNSQDGTGPVGGVTLGVTSLLDTGGGTAASFDGSTGRIPLPNHTDFEATAAGGFTVEMWLQVDDPTTTDAFQIIATKTDASISTYGQWYIAYDNRSSQGSPDRLRFILGQGTDSIVDWIGGGASLAAGGYLVARKDGDDLTLWWDGTLVASHTVVNGWNLASGTSRSLNLAGFSGGTFWLGGTLDEFAIYQSALPDARIAAHYAAAQTPGVNLTLADTLPALVDSMTIRSFTRTDTTNGRSGRIRGGYAIHADNTDPVTLPAAAATRRDKALWYPDPDLVDGRPT